LFQSIFTGANPEVTMSPNLKDHVEGRSQPWKTWVTPERPASACSNHSDATSRSGGDVAPWNGWTPDPENPHFKPWLGPQGWLAPSLKADDKFFNWHGNGQG